MRLFTIDIINLGAIETDCVISESCYNEVIYYRHNYRKIINLGAMRWSCYIENCINEACYNEVVVYFIMPWYKD